ncbi:T9SS type A sorting domain-containing protein [candidate division KSB1 bacterium]|nr:T9SS type A sorting domain-containing protein [candidate division KSB1 bacterium]
MRAVNSHNMWHGLLILMIFVYPILHANTPHMAYGTLQYQDGSTPASTTFQAFITDRSSEVLTHTSFGCDYSGGVWSVQVGNYPSPWSAGELLHVNFNDGAGKTGSIELSMTNDPGDNAWVTTLSVQDGTVKLLLPDTTVDRGATVQIPVYLEGLGVSDSVVAYQMTVGFDSDVLIATGALSGGTMTEPWGNPFAAPQESSMTLAGFTTNQPSTRLVPDGGRLVYLEFLVHGIPDDPISSSTEVYIEQAILYTIESNTAESQVVSNTKVGIITVQSGSNPATRNISIYPNWNLISFGIVPDPHTVPEVFGSLSISYAFGFRAVEGPMSWDVARPSFLNDLKIMDGLHGYWVKSSASIQQTWNVSGDEISINTPIPMYAGWNLIGYLPTSEDQILHSFGSIDPLFSYVSGFESGTPKVWDRQRPEFLNDLQTLHPHSGYWVKMDSARQLIYPSGGYSAAKQTTMPYTSVAFLQDSIIVTPFWCDFWGVQPDLIAEGDTIQVFDPDSVLCGEGHGTIEGGYLIHVFGDDPNTTDLDEGAIEDDTLRFVINGTETKVIDGSPVWEYGGSKQVSLELVSSGIGQQNNILPESAVLVGNYPNPFNPSTTVHYMLDKPQWVQLSVFDVSGKEVCVLLQDVQYAGSHFIQWNGHDDRGQLSASGVYIIQLQTLNLNLTHKCLLIK